MLSLNQNSIPSHGSNLFKTAKDKRALISIRKYVLKGKYLTVFFVNSQVVEEIATLRRSRLRLLASRINILSQSILNSCRSKCSMEPAHCPKPKFVNQDEYLCHGLSSEPKAIVKALYQQMSQDAVLGIKANNCSGSCYYVLEVVPVNPIVVRAHATAEVNSVFSLVFGSRSP